MESFDRFQLAGLALVCLKNETKADAEDLRDLISAAGADVAEKARRERLLRHLESVGNILRTKILPVGGLRTSSHGFQRSSDPSLN